LNCPAGVEAGDRILYFPGGGIMCANCGQEKERAEREARRRTLLALADGRVGASAVYDGSDAALTRAFLKELAGRGPEGEIAALLFRAQKASRRAKLYGRTSYRELSYGRKGESLKSLTEALVERGAALQITFGWGRDGGSFNPWVLYVELPAGDGGEALQVSFHSPERYAGPDYPTGWDGRRASEERILEFCERVLGR
jgi:hypothetical protein